MTSEQHRYFDSYTEPLDVLADTAPEDRLLGYDMENETILFRGEAYELGPPAATRGVSSIYRSYPGLP